ncbi:hypothetical protein Dsin_021356 [Dipteronia sinensis]|uniref:Reverse transcriptase domain-containing protein n=1 Tax=Dipteronia sinensis TaxID=43782 RepID=A0AAE0A0T5_9ROSI|nr:hypothetical protein Dsin_021356 [Dipteronia sinensis]
MTALNICIPHDSSSTDLPPDNNSSSAAPHTIINVTPATSTALRSNEFHLITINISSQLCPQLSPIKGCHRVELPLPRYALASHQCPLPPVTATTDLLPISTAVAPTSPSNPTAAATAPSGSATPSPPTSESVIFNVERDNYEFQVKIVYEKLPPKCARCGSIGHELATCRIGVHPSKPSLHGDNINGRKDNNNIGTDKSKLVYRSIVKNNDILNPEVSGNIAEDRVNDMVLPTLNIPEQKKATHPFPVESPGEETATGRPHSTDQNDNADLEVDPDPITLIDSEAIALIQRQSSNGPSVDDEGFELVISKTQRKRKKNQRVKSLVDLGHLEPGIANLKTREELANICHFHKPDIVCLSEPMVDFGVVPISFWNSLKLQLVGCNDRRTLHPNLWLFCSMDMLPLSILSCSQQEITLHMVIDLTPCMTTFVYASTSYLTFLNTTSWHDNWLDTSCIALPKTVSDQCALLFNNLKPIISGAKPFRFQTMWIHHKDFRELVVNSWTSTVVYGCPMFIFVEKLRVLKRIIRVWNKNDFGNVHDQVVRACEELSKIQCYISIHGMNEENYSKEAAAKEKVYEVKAAKCNLNCLMINDSLSTDHVTIANHVVDYYSNLYNSPHQPFANEIKDAVFAMDPTSAPDPDGFPRAFLSKGDPLSPLPFFCLAEEALSRGISHLHANGKLKPISSSRGCVPSSHALYVDDVFVFCKANARSLNNLMALLDSYDAASGQYINKDKCFFYLGKQSLHKESNIQSLLGFSTGKIPFTYLGVPIFNGRPPKSRLQSLADKVRSKLECWFGKLLSYGGSCSTC